MKNLDLWKELELKYKLFEAIKINKNKRRLYREKVKFYNFKTQESLSSLMDIFLNLKKLKPTH